MLCRIIVIVSALFIAAASHAAPLQKIDISGVDAGMAKAVRNLLPLKEGEEFDPAKLKRGLELIDAWGLAEVVSADPVRSDGGVALQIVLKKHVIISRIDVSGNFPYLEGRLTRYLTIQPGDPYHPEILDEQKEKILDFYRRKGHFDAAVSVEEKAEPALDGVALTFHIHRGIMLRYRHITAEGANAYPQGRIISYINPLLPYSDSRLRNSLKKIRDFYRSHNYPQARASVKDKKFDLEKKDVDLVLEIDEGPHLIVIYSGDNLPVRELKKRLIFAEEGRIDRLTIEDSCTNMIGYLRSKGYPEATCSGERTKKLSGYQVTFNIDKGSPMTIKQIRFSEKPDFDQKPLKEAMANRQRAWKVSGAYYPELKDTDNEAILNALANQGFLEAKIGEWQESKNPKNFSLDLNIPVDEGPQTIVASITFTGAKPSDSRKLFKAIPLKRKKPYSPDAAERSKALIASYFGDNGYPYAAVDMSKVSQGGKAHVTYTIDRGPLVRVGAVLFVGDVLTSQKAMRRALKLKEGETFSNKKILETQLAMQQLGAFSAVRIDVLGLEQKEPEVHLKIKVTEQKPFLIETSLGYSTDDGVIGTFRFNNINAFGWAKQQGLRLIGGNKLSRAEVNFYDPRFLSSSFELGSSAWTQYRKRPAFTYIQIGGAIGLYRRYKRFTFLLREELDRNYLVTGDSVAADAESLRNNTISRVTLGASFDSRDSFEDPKKGVFTTGSVEMFNEIKGNNANFLKLAWTGEADASAWRFTVSTLGRIARLETIGSNVSIPTPELLFLGGDDTIRGFATDSLGPKDAKGDATGARFRWIVNEELRFRITKKLQVVGFYDMGSLTMGLDDFGIRSVRNSVGFGIRIITPVGPIRADYGIKLDREKGEDFGRFHLTFGYMF